jgi:hypothetical protein
MIETMSPSWFVEGSARAAAGVVVPTVARHHAAAVQYLIGTCGAIKLLVPV